MSSEMFIDTEVCYLIDNTSLLFILTVIARVTYIVVCFVTSKINKHNIT